MSIFLYSADEKPDPTLVILNQNYSYGYEFYGAQAQVGLTPQTDKCFLSMSQALASNRGAMLVGGPGVGKTETVKVRIVTI